ncbi:hypothetical protein [Chitinilyticum aquatile]|uniref:hypothetical protein n=1 Tax=Chitinilyticum aquatile TaxID=362520 RepID=UPI00048E4AE1|nr:hypothetical protein [Chitinilyticum aquatile]
MDTLIILEPYFLAVSYSIMVGIGPGVLVNVVAKVLAMRHCISHGYLKKEVFMTQNGPLRETGRLLLTKEYKAFDDDKLNLYAWFVNVVSTVLAVAGFLVAIIGVFFYGF